MEKGSIEIQLEVIKAVIEGKEYLDFAYNMLPYKDEEALSEELSNIRALVNLYINRLFNSYNES